MNVKNDYYQYKLETSIHPKTLELVQHVIYERIYYFGDQFSRINEKNVSSIRPGFELHPKYFKQLLASKFIQDL